MLPVIDFSERIENSSRRLALECADHIAQNDGRRISEQEVYVVGIAVNLGDFAVTLQGELAQYPKQKVSPQR
jgi:hypothetical protein